MKNIVKKLIQKKLKISFVESCTGGMLASFITSISGAKGAYASGRRTKTGIKYIANFIY